MDANLIGRWEGLTPTGDVIRYDFRADHTVVWTVESPDSPGDITARYSVDASIEPHGIDIFDFDVQQLHGFRFLGIYQQDDDDEAIRFYGAPRGPDDDGPRPAAFPDETIVLRRPADGRDERDASTSAEP